MHTAALSKQTDAIVYPACILRISFFFLYRLASLQIDKGETFSEISGNKRNYMKELFNIRPPFGFHLLTKLNLEMASIYGSDIGKGSNLSSLSTCLFCFCLFIFVFLELLP